jgi:pyruvate dehydrogenase (quinone)
MADVAHYILERLSEWGIERIYGYPGDGINGFLGAFEKVGKPEFIQTRHEEMAAFMACAHAKFTGEVGACIATSGPGAIHLINGLYDAKLDHQPVLAVVGQQKRHSVGAHYQQEIDLQVLFKDVGGFVSTVMDQYSARHVIDRAVKSALTERRPSVVIVPEDVQEAEYSDPPRMHGSVFTSVGWNQPHAVPDETLLRQAAQILNEGEKVAMLIGQGARRAATEVIEAAEPPPSGSLSNGLDGHSRPRRPSEGYCGSRARWPPAAWLSRRGSQERRGTDEHGWRSAYRRGDGGQRGRRARHGTGAG